MSCSTGKALKVHFSTVSVALLPLFTKEIIARHCTWTAKIVFMCCTHSDTVIETMHCTCDGMTWITAVMHCACDDRTMRCTRHDNEYVTLINKCNNQRFFLHCIAAISPTLSLQVFRPRLPPNASPLLTLNSNPPRRESRILIYTLSPLLWGEAGWQSKTTTTLTTTLS